MTPLAVCRSRVCKRSRSSPPSSRRSTLESVRTEDVVLACCGEMPESDVDDRVSLHPLTLLERSQAMRLQPTPGRSSIVVSRCFFSQPSGPSGAGGDFRCDESNTRFRFLQLSVDTPPESTPASSRLSVSSLVSLQETAERQTRELEDMKGQLKLEALRLRQREAESGALDRQVTHRKRKQLAVYINFFYKN